MDDITIDENYDAVKEEFFKGLTFRQTVYAFLTILGGTATYTILLMVLHLPQIAAMADVHFSVEKGVRKGRTFTAVEALDRPRRQQELARLAAGAHITPAALESAGELLDAAESYKRQ